jgi:predicted negative regulator of RcsB-dependent stress response
MTPFTKILLVISTAALVFIAAVLGYGEWRAYQHRQAAKAAAEAAAAARVAEIIASAERRCIEAREEASMSSATSPKREQAIAVCDEYRAVLRRYGGG